jgi:hypothetical protein
MRRFLYLLTACLMFLLLSSESCNSNRQENSAVHDAELTRDMENLKTEFESDVLTEKSLNAYEIKAKQKLVDLSDYLNLYTVKSVDGTFKTQARQMIQDLFVSDRISINGLLLNNPGKKDILISDFLALKFDYSLINLKFDSIQIYKPLQRINDNNYFGSLRFLRYLQAEKSRESLTAEPIKMDVDITVSKVRKAFGNDTLQVWNLYLGNIH